MNSLINLKKTAAEEAFAAHYESASGELPGGAKMQALRGAAMRAFAASGLPHRRVEAWKYTNLRQLLKDAYPPCAPGSTGVFMDIGEAAAHSAFANIRRAVMVFVDGHYRAELSNISPIEKSVEINTLRKALEDNDPLVLKAFDEEPHTNPMINLNLAMMSDGALICVGDGADIKTPLHLVHISSAAASCTSTIRHLVHIGAGASLNIIETHAGTSDTACFSNIVMNIKVKENGRFTRIKVQDCSRDAFHFSHMAAIIGKGANLRDFTLTLGSHLARNEADIILAGKSANAHVSGAYLLGGKQHSDNWVRIEHRAPECSSDQQFRGVIDDAAQGIFQGIIKVAPDAQKTDGRQMIRALLLSERAAQFSKPELEIFADDVQCAHGATIGELDDEALFFLRARGIPEAEAKALLISGFIGEALDDVIDVNIRERLDGLTAAWLEQCRGEAR